VTVIPHVEDKAWPFVISVIPPQPDIAFFELFFAKQMEMLNRKERWVHVVDIRPVVKLPDSKVRFAIAEQTKKIEALSSKYNMGTATIIKSSLVRGILTAIHWLLPPPHPFANVATAQEGVDYLRGCLQKADMVVPSRMTAEFVEIVAARFGPSAQHQTVRN
jgi:hypothetical protein